MDGDRNFSEAFDIHRNRRLKKPRLKLAQGSDRVVLELPASLPDPDVARFIEQHRTEIQASIMQLRRRLETRQRADDTEPPGPQATPEEWSPTLPAMIDLVAVNETWKVIHQADSPGSSRPNILRPDWQALTFTFEGPPWKPCCAFRTLRKVLKVRAQHYLVPLVEELERRSNLAAGDITVRAQRTRWGSCSANGNLSLNLTLLFLPHRLVEYVVLHELCHTVELNHADAFWDLLQKHLPDASTRRGELRRAEQQLPRWVSAMLAS